ncbi:MAG: peptide deformylase [Acidobacteria bacterium]|nr:peptide deformylase [Acidobacteriota bacterium]MDA1235002.1 peptide deformylase [Acidobacteriota bacterium]
MLRKIYLYGDPVLETDCDPVTDEAFGTPELIQLVEDMFETMDDSQGVGLAAPQIGETKRLFVVDVSAGEDRSQRRVLINPEIVDTSGEQFGEEGCLSIPGFREKVRRPFRVTAKARDVEGNEHELEGDNLLARAILHENDHLNGVLFLQHLSALKRSLIQRKIQKLRKKGEWD